jgi:hypothetical protein
MCSSTAFISSPSFSMLRIEDIEAVDSLYDEVTDETEMAAWARDIMQKFYPPRMRDRSYRS